MGLHNRRTEPSFSIEVNPIKQRAGQNAGPTYHFAGGLAIQRRGKNVAMAFEVLRAPIDFLRPVKPLEAGDLVPASNASMTTLASFSLFGAKSQRSARGIAIYSNFYLRKAVCQSLNHGFVRFGGSLSIFWRSCSIWFCWSRWAMFSSRRPGSSRPIFKYARPS